jgi:hypothetical protein
MIQLFDATFHSTAEELELMMRISDNITRGGEEGSGNTHPPEIKEFFFLLSIILFILFGFVNVYFLLLMLLFF